MMKQFGLIGHPVSYSLSPLMHNTAFSLLGLDCTYQAYDVGPTELGNTLRDFRTRGFAGLNVTIPHKETILGYLDTVETEASAIGAVNAIAFDRGRLIGHNTDAYGVRKSLEPFQAEIAGSTVLLLGAGGASRAVSYALLKHFSPGELIIAGRSEQRAEHLAARCKALSADTKITTMDIAADSMKEMIERSRLIINATPVGMTPSVDHSPLPHNVAFRRGQIALDLIYTPLETKFLKAASSRGARTISGLEMFIYQGARSCEIWTGREMPIAGVRPVLEQRLKIHDT
jgi:shikimate dehydrogenase